MFKILFKEWYYEFLSLFVPQKVRYKVLGKCVKCGACCKDIRIKGGATEKDLKLTQFFFSHYRHFHLVRIEDNGDLILSCDLLNEDNTCSIYEKRPRLCKNYPAKYLYFNGVMHDTCGFYTEPEKFFEDYLN